MICHGARARRRSVVVDAVAWNDGVVGSADGANGLCRAPTMLQDYCRHTVDYGVVADDSASGQPRQQSQRQRCRVFCRL